jgi:hypothetical protein
VIRASDRFASVVVVVNPDWEVSGLPAPGGDCVCVENPLLTVYPTEEKGREMDSSTLPPIENFRPAEGVDIDTNSDIIEIEELPSDNL